MENHLQKNVGPTWAVKRRGGAGEGKSWPTVLRWKVKAGLHSTPTHSFPVAQVSGIPNFLVDCGSTLCG